MLIDVRRVGRRARSAAGVVILRQPDTVHHSERTGGRDTRSVRLRASLDGVEAEILVEDVPALIEELRAAEKWRKG